LLGASCILTGTIADLNNNLTVNARVVDTQTGVVSAAAEVDLVKDPDVIRLSTTERDEIEVPKPLPEPQSPGPAPAIDGNQQRLMEENRKLKKQMDQLQKENLDLKSQVNKLKSQLSAVPRKPGRVNRPFEIPAVSTPPEEPAPEQVLRLAEEALGKIDLTGS